MELGRSINDLPDNVLLSIFELCLEEAYDVLPLVCWGWKRVLEGPSVLWKHVTVPRGYKGRLHPNWSARVSRWVALRRPSVRALTLRDCPTLASDVAPLLASLAPTLWHLSLCQHTLLDAIQAARVCTKLTSLDLWLQRTEPPPASPTLFAPLVPTLCKLSIDGWLGEPAKVPEAILSLTNLRELQLGLRGITHIQSGLFLALPRLARLQVSHALSLVIDIPEDVGAVSALRELVLSGCNIHNMWGEARWLRELPRLRKLERVGVGRLYDAPSTCLADMWCCLNGRGDLAPEMTGGVRLDYSFDSPRCIGWWVKGGWSRGGSQWQWQQAPYQDLMACSLTT